MRNSPEIQSNEEAWNIAAQKYAANEEFEKDVELLRGGGSTLLPIEIEELGPLNDVELAVHLCCSHGSDVLSMLNHGAKRVVGVDISDGMLSLARRKTEALAANAQWIHADVLTAQTSLNGKADLVYIGRGGLPWVQDLNLWAQHVFDMLQPGGRLYVFEGHPLNWIWARDSKSWQVIRNYFQAKPLPNEDFPAMAVLQFSKDGTEPPQAFEWQWSIADTVTAIANAGLRLEFLHEHPFNFWPLFDEIDLDQDGLVPQSFSLLATKA